MEPCFTPDQAYAEAGRCLLCFDAPCSKGCPAGTDPGTFIRKLRLRNIKGAIATVKHNNILGGVCGALCPVSGLCEKECAATPIDRPIRIGSVQRFLIEYGRKLKFDPLEKKDPNNIKIAIKTMLRVLMRVKIRSKILYLSLGTSLINPYYRIRYLNVINETKC